MSLEHAPQRQGKRGSAATFTDTLLTFDDIAERLSCSRKTVKKNYSRQWGLRPVRIAGKVLVPASQLAALEQRLIETGETI